MAGTIVASTLSDGTNSTSTTNCIQGSAKAWVNFNGSTATVRASYNVSSVTRTNTGRYTVNLTNAMSDTNYAVTTGGTANASADAVGEAIQARMTSTSVISMTTGSTASYIEFPVVCVSVFR